MVGRKPPSVDDILYGDRTDPTRRKLLTAMGMAGAAGVAGCLGDDSEGEDEHPAIDDTDLADLEFVEGQELLLTTEVPPDETTFMSIGPGFGPHLFGDGNLVAPTPHWELMMDHGMWGRWSNMTTQAGEPELLLFDDFEITDDEIRADLRDDAVWSDGTPMTGRDFTSVLTAFRMWPNVKPPSLVREEGPGQIETEPITQIEYDDDGFTLISEGGYFAEETDQDIYREMLTRWRNWAGVHHPTHIEPYSTYQEHVWDIWEELQAGEREHLLAGGDLHILFETWGALGVGPEGEDVEAQDWGSHFRDPEEVVTCGAWTLESIEGTQAITFEPNEHHRNSDLLNFDRIRIEHREARANWASLEAQRLDFYDGFLPEDIVADLPSVYSFRPSPTDDGIGLALDHSTPFFEHVKARQAFMYLIDTEALVNVESEGLFEPVFVPGGDAWNWEEFLSEEFVEDTLNRYDHDPDRAAELFEEAGWSQEDGNWYLPNGDRASIEIPTADTTPRWQLSLRDQLQEFGIEAVVRARSGEDHQELFVQFEHDWWHDPHLEFVPGLGHMFTSMSDRFAHMVAFGWWARATNVFPEEQIEQTEYADMGDEDHRQDGAIQNTSTDPEGFGGYTIEAPAVGDWDGPTQEWEATAMAWEAFSSGDREDLADIMEELAWIVNWSLPGLPLAHATVPLTVNSANWLVPRADSADWEPVGQDRVEFEHLLAMGDKVLANSENPK